MTITSSRDLDERYLRRWGLLAAGGTTGTLARWGLESAIGSSSSGFPWGTFAANVSGSFALGFLMVTVVERIGVSQDLRTFAFAGVLGSFTTFSKLAVDGVIRIDGGDVATATVYWSASVVVGLTAALTGMWVARL